MEDQQNININELVKKSYWESNMEQQLDAIKYITRVITAYNCQQFVSSKISLQLQIPKDRLEFDELYAITQAKLQLYLKIAEICQYKHQFIQISNFVQDLLQFPQLHENILILYIQILANVLQITLTLQKPHLYILIKHVSLLVQLSQQHYIGFNSQSIQQYLYKQKTENEDIAFTTIAINKQKYKVPTQMILNGPKYQLAQVLKYIALITSQELFSVSLRLISSTYQDILKNADSYPYTFHQMMKDIIQILLYDRSKNIEIFSQIEKKHIQIQALLPTQQLQIKKQDFIIKSVMNNHINNIFSEELSKYSNVSYYQSETYQQWLENQTSNSPYIQYTEENPDSNTEIVKLLINQLDKNTSFNIGTLFINYIEILALNQPFNNVTVIINELKKLSNRQLDSEYTLKSFQSYYRVIQQIYYKCGLNQLEKQSQQSNRTIYYQEFLLFSVPINTFNQQNLSYTKENKYLLQLYNSFKLMIKKQTQKDKQTEQETVSEKQKIIIQILIENIKFIKFLLNIGYIQSYNMLTMIQKQFILPQNIKDNNYQYIYEKVFLIVETNNIFQQQQILLSNHPYRSILTYITLQLYKKENLDLEFLKMPQNTKLNHEQIQSLITNFRTSAEKDQIDFYQYSLAAIATWDQFDIFKWFFNLISGKQSQINPFFEIESNTYKQPDQILLQSFIQAIHQHNVDNNIKMFIDEAYTVMKAFINQFTQPIQQLYAQTIKKLSKKQTHDQNQLDYIQDNVIYLTGIISEIRNIYNQQKDVLQLNSQQHLMLENTFQVIQNMISLNIQRVYSIDSIIDNYRYINLVQNKQELQQIIQFLNFLTIEKLQDSYTYFTQQYTQLQDILQTNEQLLDEKTFKEQLKQLKRQLRDFVNENEIVYDNLLHNMIINILNKVNVKLNIQKYVGFNIQLIISLKVFIFSQYEMNKFDQLIYMLVLILQSQFEDTEELYVNILDSSQIVSLQNNEPYILLSLQQQDGQYIPKLTLQNQSSDAQDYEVEKIFERQQNFHNQYIGLLSNVKQAIRQQNYNSAQILPFYGHTWFEFILSYIQDNVIVKQQSFSLFNQMNKKDTKAPKVYLQQQHCYQIYSNQDVDILTLQDIQLSMLSFKQSDMQTQIIDSVLLELYLTIYNLDKIIFDTQTFKLIFIIYRLGYQQLIEQLLSVKDNHQIVGSISRYCMLKQASLYSFFFITFNIMQDVNINEFKIIMLFLEYLNDNQTILYDRQAIIQYLKCNNFQDFKKLIYKFVHLQINILNKTDEDKIRLFRGRKRVSYQICKIIQKHILADNGDNCWGKELDFKLISQLWNQYN